MNRFCETGEKMRDLNINFMELYKQVDRFIKDAYSSSTGVSEYIQQMESDNIKGNFYLSTWKEDYSQLKQMRWIRNQLAHEVGYDSDICSEEDYYWLENFYNRLFSRDDPLAQIYDIDKYKEKKVKKLEAKKELPEKHEKRRTPIRTLKKLSDNKTANIVVKEEISKKDNEEIDKKRISSFIKLIKKALLLNQD